MLLMRHAQSEFNLHFNKTGRDPGIRDPHLTPHGLAQAAQAAAALTNYDIKRLVASPYRRAVHTAEIIAKRLGVDLTIDAEVGEHSLYHCDIGSPPQDLTALWPHREFTHLPQEWWPRQGEPRQHVISRCQNFHARAREWSDRDHVLVVSHWGFILNLTGIEVPNATVIRLSYPQESLHHPNPRRFSDMAGDALQAEPITTEPIKGFAQAAIVYQPSL
ncbi:MAG: histidine phosphatase family protein [Alphaproteobacteria bacterium]|nr:histidine phosphatase family protein [Alphaproteobacteria bacterium]